ETERAWKWVKRRPALSTTLALLAASMVLGTVVSTSLAIRANIHAEQARGWARSALLAQQGARAAQGRAERAEHAAEAHAASLLPDRGLELARTGEVGPGLL